MKATVTKKASSTGTTATRSVDAQVKSALAWLKARSSKATLSGMARYSIQLRAIGKRNRALNAAAVVVAGRLAASKDSPARWVGKDALRELTSPGVTRRLED